VPGEVVIVVPTLVMVIELLAKCGEIIPGKINFNVIWKDQCIEISIR